MGGFWHEGLQRKAPVALPGTCSGKPGPGLGDMPKFTIRALGRFWKSVYLWAEF